ncbi:MAG: 2-C-methyl-D-erythritol 4-phosphate cytidylyltransferase, partial [Candidatus Cloacimonetes bacterium]|nr:2-C-methyl-D-erythritol 4-phosphate cytidylyltransferase [Candidatus Cloacimonadota bacterium]
FTYQLIRSCYDRASTDRVAFTDDASVVEFYGHPVYTVSDSGVNIKLTTAIDLAIMEVMFTLFDEVDSNENTR